MFTARRTITNVDDSKFQDSFLPRSRVASTSSLGANSSTAAHPKFRDLEKRLATFGNRFDPQLADLGFFVVGECLTCFSCGLTLDEVPDKIIIEHLVQRPACEHARLIHTLQRMQSLSQRLKSFENYESSKESLAKAGFFYRKEDGRTQCAYCRIIVDTWFGVENVFEEHARLALTCPFVLNPPDYALGGGGGGGGGGGSASPHDKNLIKHSAPQYSNMASPDARLRSFKNWTSAVDKHALVECGFFSINLADYTKCFQCGGGCNGWQSDDDPWFEHARWYPDCEYVRLVKGHEFVEAALARTEEQCPELVRQDSTEPALPEALAVELDLIMNGKQVKKYEKQGLQRPVLRVALKTFMVKEQRGFSSPEELSTLLESTLHLKPPAVVQYPSGQTQKTGKSSVDKAPPEQTRDETICVVCMSEKRGAVFVPCGHMVACHKCAASVTDCPLCKHRIDQIVRTYLN